MRFITWSRLRRGRRLRASVVRFRRVSTLGNRPLSQLGAINQFESASSSVYHGMTVSLHKRRLAWKMNLRGRYRLEWTGESFNLFNLDHQRYGVTDNGYYNSAGRFVKYSQSAGGSYYPAYYQQPTSFLRPASSFAPRRMQLSMRRDF